MSYTLRESNTSKNYTPAALVAKVFGYPRIVTGITIHHWGVDGQDFDDVEKFLCTNNTPTSAHYVAQDGLVSCIVSPDDAAWHSGSAEGNATTIGIELRPEATDGDYRTAAALISFIRSIFGNVPLIPHKRWHATACPGRWDLARLDALSRNGEVRAQSASAPTTPQEESEVTPAQMQELKVFMQTEINKSINAMWATGGVIQKQIEQLGAGLNKIQAGSVDTAALAKAVNDDAAKRLSN